MRTQPDILSLPPPPADARLPYGPEPSQFGELRLPPDPGPHPVVVYLHGGFWRAAYSLDHAGHACAALAAAGLATWSLEYRRISEPGGAWPGTLQDVARGADALRDLARHAPLDLDRVLVMGHSAGGHLALWLAARHRLPPGSPLASAEPLRAAGAVSLAGVCDLKRGAELRLSAGVVEDLLGGPPRAVPERYAVASPFELLPLGVPQVLLHGTADEDVPYELSQRYATAATRAGDPVELVTLPDVGHFELIDPRSAVWPTVLSAVRRLIVVTTDRRVQPLETPRLRLVPCSRELAQAAMSNRPRLEELLGVDVTEGWPDQDLRAFLPIYARQLEADPELLGWGIWLMLHPEQRALVGSIGFKGKPDQGAVEIGYGVLPAHRQQGYATEAAQALADWAFSQPAVNRVLAECDQTNGPSIRVLEKLGMQRIGEDGAMLRWELHPARR